MPVLLPVLILLALPSCSTRTERPDFPSGLPAGAVLENTMGKAGTEGPVKIALLLNGNDGGNAWHFIDAAASEGRSLGFSVDAFLPGAAGERSRLPELALRIARADYDGLILVDGPEDGGDLLLGMAEAGLRIVTFRTDPGEAAGVPGLAATFQDDAALAELGLHSLLARSGGVPRVLRAPGETEDSGVQEKVFTEFLRQGLIEDAGTFAAYPHGDPRIATREALLRGLSLFPPGEIDALWIPGDERAIGAAEALAVAGREDILLFGTGISNESLRAMWRYRDFWPSTAAVDPRLVGTVTMRMLAALLAGEELPETFLFPPRLVYSADLGRSANLGNLSLLLPDWGDGTGLFDRYPWMAALKAAKNRFPRGFSHREGPP